MARVFQGRKKSYKEKVATPRETRERLTILRKKYGVELHVGRKITAGKKSTITKIWNRARKLEYIVKNTKGKFQPLKKVKIPRGVKMQRGARTVGDYVFVPATKGAKNFRISKTGILSFSDSGRYESIYYFTPSDFKKSAEEQLEIAKRNAVPKGSRVLFQRVIMRGGWQSERRFRPESGHNYFVSGPAGERGTVGGEKLTAANAKKYGSWQNFRKQQVIGIKFMYSKPRK
jgi:hypothetical protein